MDYAEIHFLPGWFCADKECVVSVVLDTASTRRPFIWWQSVQPVNLPYWIDVRVVRSDSWPAGIPEIENWYQRNMLYAAQRYSEDNGGLAEVNYVDLGPSSGWPTPPA